MVVDNNIDASASSPSQLSGASPKTLDTSKSMPSTPRSRSMLSRSSSDVKAPLQEIGKHISASNTQQRGGKFVIAFSGFKEGTEFDTKLKKVCT
jgi:hypothetical protein